MHIRCMHCHCLPIPSVVSGIVFEVLEDYVDNEPNTDSPADPFGDEEDDAAVL